jgi:rubrerythrin
LFLIFKDAIQNERQAQTQYKKAADLSDDPVLKSILMDFCRDEMRHEQMLLKRYKLLREQYGVVD